MVTTAYDWRKVLKDYQVDGAPKPGDSENFMEMARGVTARTSVWSIPYDKLSSLGRPSGEGMLSRSALGGTTDNFAQSKLGITSVAPATVVELRPHASRDEIQTTLSAIYKQVLGNTYVMESERPTEAESLLHNGSLSVREFVRRLAKSDLYKSRFFQSTSNNRFIELNFKHLLGRAPYDQGEIQEHFGLYHKAGFDVEIDSYIDSDEYRSNFGEYIVPYFRGFKYQTDQAAAAFPRMLKLYNGEAGSDTDRNRGGQKTQVKTADLLSSGKGFSKPV